MPQGQMKFRDFLLLTLFLDALKNIITVAILTIKTRLSLFLLCGIKIALIMIVFLLLYVKFQFETSFWLEITKSKK